MKKIIFFDAKPYDQEPFDRANAKHGYEIKFSQTKREVFLR